MIDIEQIHGQYKRGIMETRKIPKMVIIEATNRCNLRCKACPTVDGTAPVGDMSWEMFTAIVERIKIELPSTTPVCFWMLGEPFLHPKYLEMCKHLSKMDVPFYVTTNLTIWNEELLLFLLSAESTCYQIIISMDGLPGTNTMEVARPGTVRADLLYHVFKLAAMKHGLNSHCDIAVKLCLRGQDWEEMEEYVQYWLKTEGIDYVCIGRLLAGDNPVSMRQFPCQYFDHQFMVIRWDGELIPCTYNPHVVNEGMLHYGQYRIGDSLLELYNNNYISTMRDRQSIGDYPSPCDKCSYAYTGHGIRGEIEFRDDKIGRPVYYQQDYYNMFFSQKKKWKAAGFYK